MNLYSEDDKKLFDAARFWENKPIKKFVVTLGSRDSRATETRIFAANCSDRASELALQTTDLANALMREIRLATPDDLGCEALPQIHCASLKPVTAPSPEPKIQQLAAALADCLALMQACEQHREKPNEWADPVGSGEWDVSIAVAALVLKEAL
ncbi:hypothetical protein [uncultured Rheinheimera sp.]|uniref:hypothetical protein n=1 Tax=uncultured Rheinheimera sp. TaxID=400532 RepID=UPI00259782BB|nr:hypothetical protein [uncultured Rheinheimera sp.]